MNFLGHLYFSGDDQELMLHNLFGDFVRGSDLSRFPEDVQKGIRLHREIDTYMDHHPKVLEIAHELYEELPKVAGVALDLYFDHILAREWHRFSKMQLQEYLDHFYESVDLDRPYFDLPFQLFMKKLVYYNWIGHYPKLEGLKKACRGVSSRISFPNKLGEAGGIFVKYEQDIESVFWIYMEDAKKKFKIKS
ncbi:MAG: DUF479 domain-containing protein [Bacteroidetes bacterium]|nr:MAG: DUF479 domain-containing protein [Bacteroidota bacterium]